jgi:sugar O-acyltransferase (sialic acid O-acetyltransferase NeuD family)
MSTVKDIVIVGAGGLGREVFATIEACNCEQKQWNVVGFLESDRNLIGSKVSGVMVFGKDQCLDDSVWFVCAIGDPRIRCRIAKEFAEQGRRFASILHPDVRIPRSIRIGDGTVVMAGTQFTTDVSIGSHVIIYINCGITHDVDIGDFCMIAGGCNLSGGVILETGVQLGTAASVLPRRRIGAWTTIGAGSVVAKDIPANCTAYGVPCRVTEGRIMEK